MLFSFCQGQTVYKYYVHLTNSTLAPPFVKQGNYSVYTGTDTNLQSFFSNYNIISFDQFVPSINLESFSRILYLQTESNTLMSTLLTNYPGTYASYVDITNRETQLTYYPDDYGSVSPNTFVNATNNDRPDLDYINAPKAWDYGRTGNGVKIGISDARINTVDADFAGNITFVGSNTQQTYPYCSGATEPCINSWHGTLVGGIAAGIGDNNHGSTGVCPKCSIIKTDYTGGINPIRGNYVTAYDNLVSLYYAGAKVINMSWAFMSNSYSPMQEEQDVITWLYNQGVVLVASAGNKSSYQTTTDHECGSTLTGTLYGFPASYDGVISVSSVNYRYPLVYPVNQTNDPPPIFNSQSPSPCLVENYVNVRDAFSDVNGYDPNNPVGVIFNCWPLTCAPDNYTSPNGLQPRTTSNPYVDILAPEDWQFRYDTFAELGTFDHTGGGTSSSAPHVTGTVGLMFGVNTCLTPQEVESILKLTSRDVERLSFNQIYQGQIGAGALNTGDAVEFVDEAKKIDGNALIQNHIFNRFNFRLLRINNNLKIQNVTFQNNSNVNFSAKNQIDLLPGTNLKPNASSHVYLSINPSINVCTSAARHSEIEAESNQDFKTESKVLLYPNPNSGIFELLLTNVKELRNKEVTINVVDINGRIIHEQKVKTDTSSAFKIPLNISGITNGLYFVKLFSGGYVETLKFIKK